MMMVSDGESIIYYYKKSNNLLCAYRHCCYDITGIHKRHTVLYTQKNKNKNKIVKGRGNKRGIASTQCVA